MKTWKFSGFAFLCVALFIGCGRQSNPVGDASVNDSTVADSSDGTNGLPLLAMPQPDEPKGKKPTLLPKNPFNKKKSSVKDDAPAPADDAATKQPDKGSPEWLLKEIQRVQLLPLPYEEIAEKEEDDEEDEKPLTPQEEKKLQESIEKTRAVRRERNQQIIKLAEECIQKTNKDPEQEPLFCMAAHHLLDARLQLGLQNDKASIEALYEADKVFYARNPESESAAEAALTLVNLTHATARRYGLKDPRWLKEFSKQTQSYAKRFPEEPRGSVSLLLQAARICELNNQVPEAIACYQMLSSNYKETPQGQQATNVLRRLELKGKELELAGPSIDGADFDVKTMRGKMVLVVFWATNAQPFVQQLPTLIEITKKYKEYLIVVGVNLDTNEKAVDAFLEESRLEWRHIFFENNNERGWNSPLALHYGVNTLPTMFLTDPNGIVRETELDATNLEAKIREVYQPFRKTKPKK